MSMLSLCVYYDLYEVNTLGLIYHLLPSGDDVIDASFFGLNETKCAFNDDGNRSFESHFCIIIPRFLLNVFQLDHLQFVAPTFLLTVDASVYHLQQISQRTLTLGATPVEVEEQRCKGPRCLSICHQRAVHKKK